VRDVGERKYTITIRLLGIERVSFVKFGFELYFLSRRLFSPLQFNPIFRRQQPITNPQSPLSDLLARSKLLAASRISPAAAQHRSTACVYVESSRKSDQRRPTDHTSLLHSNNAVKPSLRLTQHYYYFVQTYNVSINSPIIIFLVRLFWHQHDGQY
jgi:hypothetical protein